MAVTLSDARRTVGKLLESAATDPTSVREYARSLLGIIVSAEEDYGPDGVPLAEDAMSLVAMLAETGRLIPEAYSEARLVHGFRELLRRYESMGSRSAGRLIEAFFV